MYWYHVGYDPNAASAAVAAKGLVQHGVGQKEVDEKIGKLLEKVLWWSALGYLHVNTGNFQKGIEIFNQLIQMNPKIVAAYLGRGTALALMGDLDRVHKLILVNIKKKATMDFSAAIQTNPKLTDAWKRRGQVFMYQFISYTDSSSSWSWYRCHCRLNKGSWIR